MANTYLSRTPATVGNQKTFTTSVWVKRATGTIANGDFDSSNYIISYVAQSGSPAYYLGVVIQVVQFGNQNLMFKLMVLMFYLETHLLGIILYLQ
jgi:hypothetical protein